MSFLLLSAFFPNAKYEVKLENPSKEQIAPFLQSFLHVVSSNLYKYGPIDYAKVVSIAPKNVTSLKETFSKFTVSKITELVKPAISLKLEEPKDASELKKREKKLKALDSIAVNAFIHYIFTQVYPASFSPIGSPKCEEVRVASNLPEWQVVKKVDLKKAENKEIFAALVGIYHSLHSKYQLFSPVPLHSIESGKKSYSTLLNNLQALQTTSDFASEWTAFETFNASGFPPIPLTDTIGQLYPELKIPKPRGNFGKKK